MKKLVLLCGLLTLFSNCVSAQQYYIIFFAYPKDYIVDEEPSRAGHAFVSFIKKDYLTGQTILEGKWGFHPMKQSFKALFKEEGVIHTERGTPSESDLVVEIKDVKVYERCKQLKQIWDSKNYSAIAGQTCVDFARDVAYRIPGVVIPSSLGNTDKWQWPKDFLLALKVLNLKIDKESRKSLSALELKSLWYLEDVAACKNINGLITKYGPDNVKARVKKILGYESDEGSITVTILFQNTPDQLTIYWINSSTMSGIKSIEGEVYGTGNISSKAYKKKPKWMSKSGLEYGMPISEVIALNGKHFKLYGLEWDESGLLNSWEGGKFSKTKVSPYFGIDWEMKLDESAMNTVSGDKVYSSSLPAWKKFQTSIVKLFYR